MSDDSINILPNGVLLPSQSSECSQNEDFQEKHINDFEPLIHDCVVKNATYAI